MPTPSFILLHSPLVGTLAWQFVGKLLLDRGYTVHIPELVDDDEVDSPYWQQEIASITLPESDCILVGHSGAGALLPTLGARSNVIAYIYVDAVLLFGQATRLDLLRSESEEFAANFEAHLQAGGTFPNWKDEDLAELIPDDDLRCQLLADLRPRSRGFFTEQIETPPAWDHKPCAYIQLSESYKSYVALAKSRDWIVRQRASHHFEMMTHPAAIADLLIEVKAALLV